MAGKADIFKQLFETKAASAGGKLERAAAKPAPARQPAAPVRENPDLDVAMGTAPAKKDRLDQLTHPEPPRKTSLPQAYQERAESLQGKLPEQKTNPFAPPPPAAKEAPAPQPAPGGDLCRCICDCLEKLGERLGGTGSGAGPPKTKQEQPEEEKTGEPSRWEHAKRAGGRLWEAAQSERFEKVGANFSRAGQEAGGAVGGPVGKVIGGFSKLSEKLFESLDKLRTWTSQLHEANMRFAEFSGSMMTVAAEEEIRRMKLGRERGERRAPSARMLAESRFETDKTLAGFEDIWPRIKNDVGAVIHWVLNAAFEFIGAKQAAKDIHNILDKVDEALGAGKINPEAWLNELGVDRWENKHGRPGRFEEGNGGGGDF